MQQSPSSSSNTSCYYYPSSPMSGQLYFDSAYSSYNYGASTPNGFQFSSCPYSPDSYYQASINCKSNNDHYFNQVQSNGFTVDPSYYSPITYSPPVPLVSSTPVHTTIAVQPATRKVVQPRRRRQEQLNGSPSMCPARKRISDEAIERLNAFYEIKKRPTEAEKDRLAMECNITVAQVNTWFNNARSRRGDTNPKLTQKLLKQQIDTLNTQVAILQQQNYESTIASELYSC